MGAPPAKSLSSSARARVSGYYLILYSPIFIVPMHPMAFLIYMAYMGICGVFDHSGIKFSIPGVYNSADHGACFCTRGWA